MQKQKEKEAKKPKKPKNKMKGTAYAVFGFGRRSSSAVRFNESFDRSLPRSLVSVDSTLA